MADVGSFDELSGLIERSRLDHPDWCDLSDDERATAGQVSIAEEALGCRLPNHDVEFVGEFGGGDFAFAELCSVDPHSDSIGWRVTSGEALRP